MKMIWYGLKIKENCNVLVNKFHRNILPKTLGCRKIESVSRDVKWCFDASWGLKGLRLSHTARTVPDCLRRDENLKQSVRCGHSHNYDFVHFRRVGSCRQDRTCSVLLVTSRTVVAVWLVLQYNRNISILLPEHPLGGLHVHHWKIWRLQTSDFDA